jgi:hypothetical protein
MLMGYAAKYLQAHGQPCTVVRNVTLTLPGTTTNVPQSYISLKRASRGVTNPGSREAYWEGLILAASEIASGEVLQIGNDKYLALSTGIDTATGELSVLVAKTNASLTHMRYTETVDQYGNIVQTWTTLNADVPAFGQVVTAALRQADPGLLDSTRYVLQVAKSLGMLVMDRIVFNGDNYQVESIDDIGLSGVARIQLGMDVRA